MDSRSERGSKSRVEARRTYEEPSQEEISRAIGVNCAQIIQNITLGSSGLEF